jgi:hypothetical protein
MQPPDNINWQMISPLSTMYNTIVDFLLFVTFTLIYVIPEPIQRIRSFPTLQSDKNNQLTMLTQILQNIAINEALVTHQMAVPDPSISCCVLNHHNLFYQIQNALAFNWNMCCHLALCSWLLSFH